MYPYQVAQVVFKEAVATATEALEDELKACPLKVIEIVTTGFSGTLDIQGGINGAVTMDNVAYNLMGQDGPQATVNNQLSYTTNSARYRYQISEPYARMQAVMTRTAGTISVYVYGWAMAVGGGGGSTGGSVDVASIAAGDNNIGNIDVASIAAGDNNIGNVDVASIAAGTNLIGKVGIDQTTNGTTNGVVTKSYRDAGVLHRNAITASDKLTMTAVTATAPNVLGGNLAGASHTFHVAARTAHGSTVPVAANTAVTPDALDVVKLAWTAVGGTDVIGYDIFCNTAAVALDTWLGYITAAQHASGILLLTQNTPTAGGAVNSVYVGAVGTGLAWNVNPFAYSNAWTPKAIAAVGEISCAGKTKARIYAALTPGGFSTLPTASLLAFTKNQVGASWHMGEIENVPLLTGEGQGMLKDYSVEVDGATGLVVAVKLSGDTGTSVTVHVELS